MQYDLIKRNKMYWHLLLYLEIYWIRYSYYDTPYYQKWGWVWDQKHAKILCSDRKVVKLWKCKNWCTPYPHKNDWKFWEIGTLVKIKWNNKTVYWKFQFGKYCIIKFSVHPNLHKVMFSDSGKWEFFLKIQGKFWKIR